MDCEKFIAPADEVTAKMDRHEGDLVDNGGCREAQYGIVVRRGVTDSLSVAMA